MRLSPTRRSSLDQPGGPATATNDSAPLAPATHANPNLAIWFGLSELNRMSEEGGHLPRVADNPSLHKG